MVAVAQSAERLVVVQEVAGSNPVSHPALVRCRVGARASPVEVGAGHRRSARTAQYPNTPIRHGRPLSIH